jgi:hypothetical protein
VDIRGGFLLCERVAATTTVKRVLLRRVYNARGDLSLLDALTTAFDAVADAVADGTFVTSSGIGAAQVTRVSLRSMPPEDVAEALESMFGLYDQAVANLAATGGTADDAGIFAEMIGLLVPVTEVRGDFTNLRA